MLVQSFNKTFMPTKKQICVLLALTIASALCQVMAFTKPVAGAPAYDLYVWLVEYGIQGVPGFCTGMWLVAQAGVKIKESPWQAGLTAVGGAALMKADAVLSTLGYVIV